MKKLTITVLALSVSSVAFTGTASEVSQPTAIGKAATGTEAVAPTGLEAQIEDHARALGKREAEPLAEPVRVAPYIMSSIVPA